MPRRLRGLGALLACLALSRGWSFLASQRGARSQLRAKLDDLEGVVLVPMEEDLASIEDMKPPPLPELKARKKRKERGRVRSRGRRKSLRSALERPFGGRFQGKTGRDGRIQAAYEVSCPRRLRAQAQERCVRERFCSSSVARSGRDWAKHGVRRQLATYINSISSK